MNDYFDKIFCINLDDRNDRWSESIQEFDKHNLTVERVKAIDGRRLPSPNPDQIGYGARGCSLSHANVLETIVSNGIKRALILEDDVCFAENVQGYFLSSIKFIPSNWDMLYLGGNYYGKLTYHNGPIYKSCGMYTTSSYAITYDMAKIALNEVMKLDSPVDVTYAKLAPAHKVYVFKPGIAWQRPGFSDIESAYRDYSINFKKIDHG